MGTNAKFRDLAIRTLIGEAARGDTDSMISVAHVIKNRADSGAYGDASQGGAGRVILAPKQFSMWNADMSSSGKTISPNDPLYQRAGAIVDGVFDGRIPDNTGGADHYYAPGAMQPRGRAPSWAIGQTPTATIGGQNFYKLGLSAPDATNFGHTSAPAIGTPAPAAAPLAAMPDAAKPAAVNAITSALASAKSMLGKNEVPNHDEIVKYLHDGGQDLDPHKLAWCASFVSASLQKAGLPVPTAVAKGSLQSGGANANNYLNYGTGVTDPNGVQAGDILVAKDGSHVGFAEGPVRQGPNGPEVQLLAGNEKDSSGQYTPGSYTNPETGAVANRAQVGMVGERWVPLANYQVRRPGTGGDTIVPTAAPAATPLGKGGVGSDANIPLGTAPAGAAPAVSTIVPKPGDVPATNAQPTSATAPTGASPTPGSDKYSVIQGMTTGTGRNPMLYTAANLGNLFGGSAPSAPPAAAPAAAPSPQPASAPKPLDTSYGPQLPPPTVPSGAPPASAAPGSPLSSLVTNWGSGSLYDATPVNPDPSDPRPGSRIPRTTPNTPSMGFPAMTNPFGQPPPDQQVSQLPGSMFASAQNLINLLFPSATG